MVPAMMRSILHFTLGLLLAFSLSVAAVANASAGVTMALADSGTTIEICGDGGILVVALDARGNIIQHSKTCDRCPACALATVLGATPPVLMSRFVMPLRERLTAFFISPDLRTAYLRPSARAPPARV